MSKIKIVFAVALLCFVGCQSTSINRQLKKAECKAMQFEYVIYISAPSDTVWNALVDPHIVKEYYFVPLDNSTVAIGDKISYGKHMISGVVIELKTGVQFTHSFKFAHRANEKATKVSYFINTIGDVTELVLVHEGFEKDSKTYDDIAGGWPKILSQLKTYLETGKKLQMTKRPN